MMPGCQTHIEAWTDPEELRHVYSLGYRLARISAMTCEASTMQACVRDAKAAGFAVLVTLADPARIRMLSPGDIVECRNEDDGDLSAAAYREILEDFCTIGRETGIAIGGPTCSNTNTKCARWARSIRGSGWPAGMQYLTWHSYDPHENREFAAMEELADGLPILISEFGYPSLGISDEEQAIVIRRLWTRYEAYGAACLFQLHDGPNQTEREHCYGIRRMDGTWKPSADTVPGTPPIVPPEPIAPIQESEMMQATFSLRRSQRMPHPSRPGYFTSPFPGTEDVLSVQPTGELASRPSGTTGPWESWKEEGNRAVFDDVSGYTFAIPLVD